MLLSAAALALATAAMRASQPSPAPDGRIPLVYCTDVSPTRKEQAALFERLNPRLHVALDPDNMGLDKVVVQSIAGVGPEMFDVADPGALAGVVNSGIAWDVTDALKARGLDPERDLWPASKGLTTYDGRVYAVPANLAVDAVWFNKRMFDEAHEPYPDGSWNWDRFRETARRLTRRDARGRTTRYGVFMGLETYEAMLPGFGGRKMSEDGRRCLLDRPEAIRAMTAAYDVVYRDRSAPTQADADAMASQGGWGSGDVANFQAGRAAMAIGGRWWLVTLRKGSDFPLGVAALPHDSRRAFRAYGRSVVINRFSPRREQALDFLLFLAGRPYTELIDAEADGIAGSRRYAVGAKPGRRYPDQAYDAVWIDAAAHADPIPQASPYVDGNELGRIVTGQIDLIKAGKPVEAALRDAARGVNDRIARNLADRPDLRARATTGEGARR